MVVVLLVQLVATMFGFATMENLLKRVAEMNLTFRLTDQSAVVPV